MSVFLRTRYPVEKVEIIDVAQSSEVVATVNGLQATPPPQIEILPFRTVAARIDRADLQFDAPENLAAIEAECRKNQPAAQCALERKNSEDAAKQDRDNQRGINDLVGDLDDGGKILVELVDRMEVAAAVRGAPNALLGETVCIWSIVDTDKPLKLVERVTRLRRDPVLGDFCFNVVSNIKQGFDPDAELRVELHLLKAGDVGPLRADQADNE